MVHQACKVSQMASIPRSLKTRLLPEKTRSTRAPSSRHWMTLLQMLLEKNVSRTSRSRSNSINRENRTNQVPEMEVTREMAAEARMTTETREGTGSGDRTTTHLLRTLKEGMSNHTTVARELPKERRTKPGTLANSTPSTKEQTMTAKTTRIATTKPAETRSAVASKPRRGTVVAEPTEEEATGSKTMTSLARTVMTWMTMKICRRLRGIRCQLVENKDCHQVTLEMANQLGRINTMMMKTTKIMVTEITSHAMAEGAVAISE